MKLSKVLPFLVILSLAFSAGWTPNVQSQVNQAAGGWVTDPNVQQGSPVRPIQMLPAETVNVTNFPSSPKLVPLSPENASHPVGLAFSQAEYAALKQQAAVGNAPGSKAPDVQMDPADSGAAASGSTPSSLAPSGPLEIFPGPTKAATGGWVPPDSNLAVGPTNIIACVNSAFVGYSKTGTQLFNVAFNTWWSSSQRGGYTFIFDPICKYDKLSNRFIIVALVYNASPLFSRYLVSVSVNSDVWAWYNYAFDATLDGATPTSFWADFPDVGIDNSAIYITSNQFDTSDVFQYAKVRILDKSALYGGTTPSWTDFWGMTNPTVGGAAFALRAAHNLSPNDIEYFTSSLPGSGSQLSFFRILSPLATPSFQTAPSGLAVTAYALAPNAVQPGTAALIDTGDARLLNAVMQDGYYWTAQTVSSGGATPRACFQWYQLNPTMITVVQQGIFCSSGDYFYPAVTLDSSGNMGVTFSYVRNDTYATMRFTGRLTTDTLNTLEGSAYVVDGLGPHTSGRWGDYGGAAIDPSGCKMWFIHEFAGNATTADWGTQIFSAQYPAINVTIGGVSQGCYTVASGASQRVSYTGANDGPVKIDTAVTPTSILAAQRLLYYGTGTSPTSFVEMMGLPASQLDTTYWFPWYKNDGIVDTQIRLGNVSGSNATVHIYVAGVEVTGSPFTLTTSGAGQSLRLSFALNDGPVKVVSDVPIVTTERLIYFDSGVPVSFSEMLGLPNSQLSNTYWFPWYKNVGEIDTQLRIGNVSGSTATVHVFVGGAEMTGSPFTLTASGAGQSTRLNFAGVNDGPVKIVSNQNIVAAERILYYASGLPTSFVETMGIPNGSLNTTQWFPWYKNDGIVDTQLRIGNVSGVAASVHVYIGAAEMAGSPFALTATGAGQSLRLSFTANDGPVKLVSSQNIVSAERLIYFDSGVPISFSEMMGLPDSQLSDTYWLPWYKNVGELDTQLRFAKP